MPPLQPVGIDRVGCVFISLDIEGIGQHKLAILCEPQEHRTESKNKRIDKQLVIINYYYILL